MVAFLLFLECTFYWSHRLLHHPSVYKSWHKQHHEYRGSIGFAAEYAHFVEQVVSNYLSSAGLIIVLGAHPLVWLVWLAYRLCQTYETHSGYELFSMAVCWQTTRHCSRRQPAYLLCIAAVVECWGLVP